LRTDQEGPSVKRRRECSVCTFRFNSYESTEDLAGQLEELKRRLGPVVQLIGLP
jgi:transcriptional regulator NrdR family protein